MITRETTWTSQSGRKATLGTMPTDHILNARAYLQRRGPYKIVEGWRTSNVEINHEEAKVSLTIAHRRYVVEKEINGHTYSEWIRAFTMELIERGKAERNVKEFNREYYGNFEFPTGDGRFVVGRGPGVATWPKKIVSMGWLTKAWPFG